MRPWTDGSGRPAGGAGELLQWGHGLAAVDGWHAGPSRSTSAGFNGATALRPWTGGCCGRCPFAEVASMGPRPCGRGRAILPAFPACGGRLQWGHGLAAVDGSASHCAYALSVLLQWGHGLAAVDGQQGRGRAAVPSASMGPRPCGRGRGSPQRPSTPGSPGFNGATALRPWTERRATIHGPARMASMGPRPCGRGRSLAEAASRAGAGLQWGHGLAAVDGCAARARVYRELQALQWGHGLAAVDGAPTCGCRRGRPGFNGATALRPWTGAPAG